MYALPGRGGIVFEKAFNYLFFCSMVNAGKMSCNRATVRLTHIV